jgi:hypothetical protein
VATDFNNLIAARSNIIAALAASTLNPQPSYSISGGQQVDWNGYRTSLNAQLQTINEQIAAAEGPWEIAVRGMA